MDNSAAAPEPVEAVAQSAVSRAVSIRSDGSGPVVLTPDQQKVLTMDASLLSKEERIRLNAEQLGNFLDAIFKELDDGELINWHTGNLLFDLYERLNRTQRGASRIHNALPPEEIADRCQYLDEPEEWVELSRLGWWDTIQVRAARRGRTESLDKLLFSRNGDTCELISMHGCVNAHGDSVLHVACLENHVTIARLILECETLRSKLLEFKHCEESYTLFPLGVAIMLGHGDVVDELLRHGASADCVSAVDHTGLQILASEKALIKCLRHKSVPPGRIVRSLVREGEADLERRISFLPSWAWEDPASKPEDEIEGTVLIEACVRYALPGQPDDDYPWLLSLIRALLEEGAQVDTWAEDGSSPLSIAYSKQLTTLIKLLNEFQRAPEQCGSDQPTTKKRKKSTTPMDERARRVGVEHKLKPLDGLQGAALKAAQSANQQVVARAEKAAGKAQGSSSSSSETGRRASCISVSGPKGQMDAYRQGMHAAGRFRVPERQ